MDYKFILLWLTVVSGLSFPQTSTAQHEDIPYQDVQRICDTCVCLTTQAADKHAHHMLSCGAKNFKHILARWPKEFGTNHNGVHIVASFSGNSIEILQQLPATNATLTFVCRHCGISHLQVPTFMDVPNIKRLDLSFNEITTEELTPDVFRGPYRATHYEPIALTDLDLSYNRLHSLHRKLFEHTPNLSKLNLSSNAFSVLDSITTLALSSAINLEVLDLSQMQLSIMPPLILKTLRRLRVLNLAGNQFVELPTTLQYIGSTLEVLDLSKNQFERLQEQNFLNLRVLKRLRISGLQKLSTIANGTFTRLQGLEYLDCSRNSKLISFDLTDLLHCNNLTELDLSYCGLTTLSLGVDLSSTIATNATNSSMSPPWPNLNIFETVGNPWLCDCDLMQTLEFIGAHHQRTDTETRCENPYIFAGARLSNLTAKQICSMQIPKKFRVIDDDPPRFLRKRYIILTAITAAVVIALGLIVGFIVACVRRRLKSDDYGVEPIRYTSVRSSNLSAFAIPAPTSNTQRNI